MKAVNILKEKFAVHVGTAGLMVDNALGKYQELKNSSPAGSPQFDALLNGSTSICRSIQIAPVSRQCIIVPISFSALKEASSRQTTVLTL